MRKLGRIGSLDTGGRHNPPPLEVVLAAGETESPNCGSVVGDGSNTVAQVTSTKQRVAEGTSIAAAAVLVTVGVLQFLQGISALVNDDVFVVGVQYVYKLDLTTWGWIHLILGVVLALVGAALFTGATWARAGAVVVLSLSIVANFLWLPYYPWWSVTLIALAIVGLWGLATWQPDRV